jgi:AraC-like DNA-binding protein
MNAPSTRPLQYVEMPPAPAVTHLVLAYWGFAVHRMPRAGFTHLVWPDGCVSLVLLHPPRGAAVAVLSGPRTTVFEVPVTPGETRWGIRFRPEAGALVCGLPATTLRDTVRDARSVLGSGVDRLLHTSGHDRAPGDMARAFDAWIQREAGQVMPQALVRDAVARIIATDGKEPIADLVSALRVSPRHLQRQFRHATGLSPKDFATIRRARAALKRLAKDLPAYTPSGLSRVAADAGFADQAHLTRECRRLLSLSPAALATLLEDIAHHQLLD